MTNVERLWFRNLNKKWITLPQGADNDPIRRDDDGNIKPRIRSVNYYDSVKKRWLNPGPRIYPDWIWELAPLAGSLNLHTSDADWDNPYTRFNPNPPAPDGWVRLTPLRPRNNPNWKILHFTTAVPLRPPAYPQNPYEPFDDAYPFRRDDPEYNNPDWNRQFSLGGITTINLKEVYEEDYQFHPGRLSVPFLYGYSTSLGIMYDLAFAGVVADNFERKDKFWHMWKPGLIDLRKYRQYQEARWPQSKFFTGQYKPMSTMRLKRVVLSGKVVCKAFLADNYNGAYLPDSALTSLWPQFQYDLKWDSGVPTEPVPPPVNMPVGDWDVEFGNRRPFDKQASGMTFKNLNAIDFPMALSNPNRFYREITADWSLVLDEPAEDNLKFSIDIRTPGRLGETYYPRDWDERPTDYFPAGISAVAGLGFDRMDLHYAVPGHDTPEETWTG